MRGGLEGDTVLVRLEKPRKRARAEGVREGVVVRVRQPDDTIYNLRLDAFERMGFDPNG